MVIKQYKFIQIQRDDETRYFILHKLKCLGLLWMPLSNFETHSLAKAKEVELNKEGLCLVDWEFLDRTKDCNDWEGT
jgi:hypothetical protein